MERSYWDRIANSRLTRRRTLAIVAASGASAAILAACGSDDGDSSDEDTGGSSSSTGKPQPGGRYASYLTFVSNYSVVANYHDGYSNSGITAYDRPLTTASDGSGKYNLEAMAKIELAEPTRLVMTLKPDLVYQNKAPVNGRKVVASDIVATQNFIKTLPTAIDSNFQRTFVESFEAPNETTVVYRLKQPSAYLFSSTYLGHPNSQPIVPAEMLESLDKTPALGSGPYELVDHVFGQKYTYKKFENFREARNGMPYIPDRETFVMTDPVALEAAFRSGQLSEFLPPSTIVDRLLSELDKTKSMNATFLNSLPTGIVSMMDPQAGARPWHDVRVREALYRLTNKQQWVDLVFDRKAVVNKTPIPEALTPWLMDAKTAEPYFKEDVAIANQLLSAANYDKSQEWEIIIASPANSVMAEVWQQQLSRGGFKIRPIVIASTEAHTTRVLPGKFDFRAGQFGGADTPATTLRNSHSSQAGQNLHYGLFNKEIDALIEKSETATNRDENIRLVKDIQKRILEQYTMAYFPVSDQKYVFYDARLQDFVIDPQQGQDYQYRAWIKSA